MIVGLLCAILAVLIFRDSKPKEESYESIDDYIGKTDEELKILHRKELWVYGKAAIGVFAIAVALVWIVAIIY